MGLGGNPYGPAGTGKTESVKALGGLFGRQVLVFNCDEVCRILGPFNSRIWHRVGKHVCWLQDVWYSKWNGFTSKLNFFIWRLGSMTCNKMYVLNGRVST